MSKHKENKKETLFKNKEIIQKGKFKDKEGNVVHFHFDDEENVLVFSEPELT